MPKIVKHDVMTPADRLRTALTEAEIIAANMKGAGQRAVRLLDLLDDIDREYKRLSETSLDLRSEEGRIAGLHSSLPRQMAVLVRELRPLGGLARLRHDRQPARSQWWWFLDEDLAAERKRKLRKAGAVVALLIVVAAVGTVVYRTFFRPDPLVIEVYGNLTGALDEIMLGNYEKAIPFMERNLQLEPAEPEWPIRLGVLHEVAGDPLRSQGLFDRGYALSGNGAEFHLQRAQAYSDVGGHEAALRDAQRAIELDSSLPMGFFLLGRSLSNLQQWQEAIAAYEKVLELTQDSKGDETIYVLTKIELVRVYQSHQLEPPQSIETRTPGASGQ